MLTSFDTVAFILTGHAGRNIEILKIFPGIFQVVRADSLIDDFHAVERSPDEIFTRCMVVLIWPFAPIEPSARWAKSLLTYSIEKLFHPAR